jgi:hypothetical protein
MQRVSIEAFACATLAEAEIASPQSIVPRFRMTVPPNELGGIVTLHRKA